MRSTANNKSSQSNTLQSTGKRAESGIGRIISTVLGVSTFSVANYASCIVHYALVISIFISLLAFSASPLAAQQRRKTTVSTQKAKTTKTKKVDKKTQLRNEKAEAERKRKQEQQRAQQLTRTIKANLDSVFVINSQITTQKRSIDSLDTEIHVLQAHIDSLSLQLQQLEKELANRRQQYARSLVQQRKQKSVQQRLTFIFSADNFAQIIRRMRYMREYITYQRAQGELLKAKQAEVNEARDVLLSARARMQNNLSSMQNKQKALEGLKERCQSKADMLNKNLAAVQKQIQEYQKREQALSDQIEKLIQAEIEAERKRREEAERRRLAEEARRNAGGGTKTDKGGKSSSAGSGSRIEKYKQSGGSDKLSSNFAANKGRLPMPVTGSYSVVRHYGMYNVQGLRNVTLNNKGIDIRAQQGSMARAIFDGDVSSIFQYGASYIVMLRHGSYISVYSGLKSVSVRKGQKVKTKDSLGAIGPDADGHYTLHFQLRRESSLLNPEQWVR